jgi:pimeloyl-ACP methyl ester carboxylesterase
VRLVLPDLTGHGASPPLPPQANLDTLAHDVLTLADSLRLPRPLKLVGHSLGGRVALAARLARPEVVGEVVLLDIAPSPMGGLVGELQRVLELLLKAPATTESREAMREFFIAGGVSGPLTDWLLMNLLHEGGYYRWRIDREALGALHRRITGTDLWASLAVPGARTRCIRGGASPYVSDADAARMQAAGCPVETLAGAGHFVHVDAQPALLQSLLA